MHEFDIHFLFDSGADAIQILAFVADDQLRDCYTSYLILFQIPNPFGALIESVTNGCNFSKRETRIYLPPEFGFDFPWVGYNLQTYFGKVFDLADRMAGDSFARRIVEQDLKVVFGTGVDWVMGCDADSEPSLTASNVKISSLASARPFHDELKTATDGKFFNALDDAVQ